MFNKILIANRGEIAVRIIRTCAELGIKTVAVYSEPDKGSLHVRTATESVNLGDGPASDNYLNPARILEAAVATGAQAIHPGYGFLAENAEFARAVHEAGLVFIGPSSEAINTMGEKVASREVALAANVPLAPGSDGPVQSAEELVAFGAEHGYPILVKASFGGGGRGMRKISSATEAAEAFDAASREAVAAFGNGEVYCERYLEQARHVEVQIMADLHGNAVYLGDRDCSVQRRYQKLIEEAPAPGLSDDLRRAMGESAVRLAKQVGYAGAGTVEYLLEGENFYFLEMNTRIQVEHPITELISGVDIVEAQLQIAAGKELPWAQEELTFTGVAIEARINAENPSNGLFVPTPGPIESITVPSAEGLRWDSGFEAGDEVLPLYDSLVGKLMAHAPTREEAIEKLSQALSDFVVEGITTTAPAAKFILDTDDFKAMKISTLWLEQSVELPDFEDDVEEDSRSEVEVIGRFYTIPFFPEGAVMHAGALVASEVPTANGNARKGKSGGSRSRKKPFDGNVKSPMQGTIININVSVGDTVTAGDTLFVLEAMKMENQIKAPQDGIIAAVNAEIGQSTPSGVVLASYEGAES